MHDSLIIKHREREESLKIEDAAADDGRTPIRKGTDRLVTLRPRDSEGENENGRFSLLCLSDVTLMRMRGKRKNQLPCLDIVIAR